MREVKSYSGFVVHVGELSEGSEALKVGDEVVASYNEVRSYMTSLLILPRVSGLNFLWVIEQSRRTPIKSNHTATHLLNLSLRSTLGSHIAQKGSLVAPTKLRFDFSHKAPIPLDQLATIERLTNAAIERDVRVYTLEVELERALQIRGLRAVFGEKYPDPVRVVSVGVEVEVLLSQIGQAVVEGKQEEEEEVSVEFCGGT